MENKYLSTSEYAKLHSIDVGNLRRYISQGRVPAIKIGNQWAIEGGIPPPQDNPVKSGKYKDWRKSK